VGVVIVSSGGSATVVEAGYVSVFGTATSLTLSCGILFVEPGGTVTDVAETYHERIAVFGTATSISLPRCRLGGQRAVAPGGVASAVTLGASEQISGGNAFDDGTMSGVSVGGSWLLDVSAGGMASDVAVSGGEGQGEVDRAIACSDGVPSSPCRSSQTGGEGKQKRHGRKPGDDVRGE
jgi:hypothetical protein